ncbi:hypothetical protein HRI_000463500 [Hibiscus trionum]|uniref:Uncharacterized protein n=1 Tax=Hibiscus trionum TaxID=183268 RepID=A0A9W7GYN4_HIBTR|nr:hypothetical protein HRI_000463500 [Hibiscus trionum]
MSVSIEALAMAGVDYMEWGMDIEEWECDHELPPPHLLADCDEEDELMKRQFRRSCSGNNNNNNPQDDSGGERVSHQELGYPDMVEWKKRIEKMWFHFISMVRTVMKLLIIS